MQEACRYLDADDGPADTYLQASEKVGTIIGEVLDAFPDDGDAVRRLMAAVTIDAKVAEQAALLAMMLEPPDPGETALFRALTGGELDRVRADAARERDELRAALESRAQVLEESRNELRTRAERELDRLRQAADRGAGEHDAPTPSRRRRADA